MRDAVRLNIENLAFGGDGLAHYPKNHPESGKVVFVAGALPEEDVLARVVLKRKDFDRAETMDVVSASSNRIGPPCRVYHSCGACQLQHLSYEAQTAIKQTWLETMLSRIGFDTTHLSPMVASPNSFGYRYRARMVVTSQGGTGWRGAKSHRVTPTSVCPILTEEAEALLGRLSRVMAKNPPGQDLQAEITAGHDLGGRPSASVIFTPWHARGLHRRAGRILEEVADDLKAVVYLGNPRWKTLPNRSPKGSLAINTGSLKISLFPGVFGQAQFEQNRALIDTVIEFIAPDGQTKVLDLMSGMGNLGLPLAKAGARVHSVEINPVACLNGRFNARQVGLETTFKAQTSELGLREAIDKRRRYDAVLLDPPRVGAYDLINLLDELGPRRIVYVSCQPASLARDASALMKKGYHFRRSAGLDLFPQTYHLESVNLFVRE